MELGAIKSGEGMSEDSLATSFSAVFAMPKVSVATAVSAIFVATKGCLATVVSAVFVAGSLYIGQTTNGPVTYSGYRS